MSRYRSLVGQRVKPPRMRHVKKGQALGGGLHVCRSLYCECAERRQGRRGVSEGGGQHWWRRWFVLAHVLLLFAAVYFGFWLVCGDGDPSLGTRQCRG